VQVTYLAHAYQILEDLPLMRSRWDGAATEASIAAFCRKWNVETGNQSWGGVRGYADDLRWQSDPLRRGVTNTKHHALAITRGELPQTRSALVDLARARGYVATDLGLIGRACTLAAILFDGGYRPCGRPFLNHAIGTAGVLANYDFCVEAVLEGLMHAAYTHRRFPPVQIQGMLNGLHAQIEARVRDLTQRGRTSSTQPVAMSSTREVEIAAIKAANEIDMRLSGEYAYSGRPPEIGAETAQRLAQSLEMVGVPGMGRTLLDSLALPQQAPGDLVTHLSQSYRIGAGGTLVPMAASR
jgi:hypothetical protein